MSCPKSILIAEPKSGSNPRELRLTLPDTFFCIKLVGIWGQDYIYYVIFYWYNIQASTLAKP